MNQKMMNINALKKYFQINEDGSNDFKVNGLCLHPNVEVLTLFYQKEFN